MAESDPPESWSEKTDPDSLYGMRKAIKANTETANRALEWSVKTYNIVCKMDERVAHAEGRHALATLLVSAGVALVVSALFVACTLGVR